MSERTIKGSIDPGTNVDSFQSAFQDGIDVIQLEGIFNFGDDNPAGGESSKRQTVEIPRGVKIKGQRGVQIIGGGASFDSDTMFRTLDSGPFRVANRGPQNGGDDRPVIFENIPFSGFKGEAILAMACYGGLEVRGCKFTRPVGGRTTVYGPLTFVHAVIAVGSGCKGHFVAQGNTCDLSDYAGLPLPDDEQFLGCMMCNFTSIEILNNEIIGHDDGIEVFLNGFDAGPEFNSTISIKNNKPINLTQTVGERWPGHIAILCCNNKSATTDILNNEITAAGRGVGLLLSGKNLNVTGNKVDLRPLNDTCPVAGFMLGFNSTLPGFPSLGPSLDHSAIRKNTLSGKANYGMFTFDANVDPPAQPGPPVNESHDNKIEDNDLRSFTPVAASLLLRGGTHDNTCVGYFPRPAPGRPAVINEGIGNIITELEAKRVKGAA